MQVVLSGVVAFSNNSQNEFLYYFLSLSFKLLGCERVKNKRTFVSIPLSVSDVQPRATNRSRAPFADKGATPSPVTYTQQR